MSKYTCMITYPTAVEGMCQWMGLEGMKYRVFTYSPTIQNCFLEHILIVIVCLHCSSCLEDRLAENRN